MTVKIGILGFGYWGPKIALNFFNNPNSKVVAVSDLNPLNLQKAANMFPDALITDDAEQVISSPDVEAIVIVLPINEHYYYAKKALQSRKHVLVEKPLTDSLDEAQELVDIALKTGKVLMVDHTFLYTGAVRRMNEEIASGSIGDIQYFDSTRINLGLFRSQTNIVWDLAPHDISILNYLLDEMPECVIATGISHTDCMQENISYITLYYPGNKIAHLNISWISPVKIRQILVGGTKKMLLYNDIEPTEKIKIYDYGYDLDVEKKNELQVNYRTGDIYIPKLDTREALSLMAEDFLNAIIYKTTPVSNLELSLNVIRIIEAINFSLKNSSKEVSLYAHSYQR